MDGCLNPLVGGCVVDWEAWSAIGTLAAVVVALWLAGRDRRDRRNAEDAEARLIATVISKELNRLENDCGEMVMDQRPDVHARLLVTDPVVRQRFEEKASAIKASETRSLLGRLHLLPAELADDLAGVLSATENLRFVVEYSMPLLTRDNMPEVNLDRVQAMVAVAKNVQRLTAIAASKCQAFLEAPPRSNLRLWHGKNRNKESSAGG